MLCCQNRGTELATHVKGALNNGGTEEEIKEVILQAACYCGMPAGIEGFRVASKAESSVVYQLCSNVSCRMLPMAAMPIELRLGERS